jgi:multidrug efflux pump subunit AcrA (membrane-fusion protein)
MRGKIQPVQRARIGTLGGGVLISLSISPGDRVTSQQEVARVRAAGGGIESITSPWAGIITSVPVHIGDTLGPGTLLATLADLSQLHVETTDVDEYIIGSLRRGQAVDLVVDALDGLSLRGVITSVGLEPDRTTAGDDYYPVVITLNEQSDLLRPGMSVRITVPSVTRARA